MRFFIFALLITTTQTWARESNSGTAFIEHFKHINTSAITFYGAPARVLYKSMDVTADKKTKIGKSITCTVKSAIYSCIMLVGPDGLASPVSSDIRAIKF